MTAPTLVAYAEVEASATSGSNITSPSVSWQTNDVIIVHTGTEGSTGGETMNNPATAGTGVALVLQQKHNSTGSDGGVGCWAAVASANSSGTFTFSATHSGGARTKTLSVEVWRGSGGIGNSVILPTGATPNTARTISLTPTGAHGAASWHVLDWNADAVQTVTPTPTTHSSSSPGPTASPVALQQSGVVTSYFNVLDDQASSGATSYGIGGTGAGPFSIVAIEIKGSGATNFNGSASVSESVAITAAGSASGAAATATPGPNNFTRAAVQRASTW